MAVGRRRRHKSQFIETSPFSHANRDNVDRRILKELDGCFYCVNASCCLSICDDQQNLIKENTQSISMKVYGYRWERLS